jgi:hypothetical protein
MTLPVVIKVLCSSKKANYRQGQKSRKYIKNFR